MLIDLNKQEAEYLYDLLAQYTGDTHFERRQQAHELRDRLTDIVRAECLGEELREIQNRLIRVEE